MRRIELERLPGGEVVTDMFSSPVDSVKDGVLSTLYCRPGGIGSELVTDGHYIYTRFTTEPAMVIRS
ncbi:MAG TPA: hypothetical protein VGC41_11290, partial [Kofleriaceae bacterium]